MKTSIVYSSATGNTKKLAEALQEQLGQDNIYCGKASPEALEADLIFVGFWAMKFTCGNDIKRFIKGLENKKVFLFATAGYDSTQEYFEPILNDVKQFIPASNEIVGSFMCQGKVSDTKKEALRDMDAAKFEAMKPKLAIGDSHPDADDIAALKAAVQAVLA